MAKLRRLPAILLASALLSACAAAAPPAQNPPAEDVPDIVVNTKAPVSAPKETDAAAPAREPDEYRVTVELDAAECRAAGVEKLLYRNRRDTPVESLYFNVPLNAFQSPDAAPVAPEYAARVYERGKDDGYLAISGVTAGGRAAAFETDGTVLRVDFPEPLALGEQTDVTLQFDAKIPRIDHRTGANDFALWFGNFFPTAAVPDGAGWHTDPYSPVGSPFYTDAANWTVTVVTPKGYIVAGTGEEATVDAGDKRVTTLTAKMARDFAFAVSPFYRVDSIKTGGGVYINFYHYTPMDGDALLNGAAAAFDGMAGLVGAYPYLSYDIVEAGLFCGTEPYTGLTLMDSIALQNGQALATLAADAARQYFGSVVGVRRAKEPWLSEGLSAFVSLLAAAPNEDDLAEQARRMAAALAPRLAADPRGRLSDDLADYATWRNYTDVQQTKAFLMCYALRQKIGADNFALFLRAYYARFSFQQATTADFRALAEETYGQSLANFFEQWLNGDGLPKA